MCLPVRHISEKEIKAAFRAAVLKGHPDALVGAAASRGVEHVDEKLVSTASAEFQKLQEAYGCLKDASLRKNYDSGKLTAARK